MSTSTISLCAFAALAAAALPSGVLAKAADTVGVSGFGLQRETVVPEARAALVEPIPTAAATPIPARAELTAPVPNRTMAAVTPAAPASGLDADARDGYRAVFAAIRASDWSAAAARLDFMPAGLLHPIARAELFLAKDSPRVEADTLVALLATAPWLPQAGQLARLATTRGATAMPALPVAQELVRLAGAPKRRSAQAVRSDQAAAALSARLLPLIREDRTQDAEALLIEAQPTLSADALVEWRQRIAWSYYLTGDDRNARRLADVAAGSSGEWAVQADWVTGLAAWRGRDCAEAGRAFGKVAARARDAEMTAAGLFWSARADMACGRPEQVQSKLRSATRLTETFYGLLAGGALGYAIPAPNQRAEDDRAERRGVGDRPTLAAALALNAIGEAALADQMLRHQARIGSPAEHETLVRLAARMNLPATQIWLSQNGPAGASLSVTARYPEPGWRPQNGWRVDRSLVLAHALQESQFHVDAVSPAGARGLMQVLPGTAELIARRRGESVDRSRLSEPALNFEYGQSYLEQLAGSWMTEGLLPKVIAAYNAGPGSVQKWNERGRNLSDPLLFIESIPFVETRAYVAIVLRNYWMYERQSGADCASLKAMAQGLWPRFPGLKGATAVRLDDARMASLAATGAGGSD